MATHYSGFLGSLEVPVVVIGDPGLATVQILDGQLALSAKFGEFLLEVLDDQRIDGLRGLRRYQSISDLIKSRIISRLLDGPTEY